MLSCTKLFCARLHTGKVDLSIRAIAEIYEEKLATQFYEISKKNADIGIFLKKEGKEISLQISLYLNSPLYHERKANTFIKILKLHGKLYHENHFQYVSNNKIFATELFNSVSDPSPGSAKIAQTHFVQHQKLVTY